MCLLKDLRALGFEVEAVGEKVRVRHRAPTPPQAGRVLLDELRRRKTEALAALAAPASSPPPGMPPTDAGSPWPAALAYLGSKTVGPFTPCPWCGAGTWVRYATVPTCLACTRSWPTDRTPEAAREGARGMLWTLLDLWAGMDETRWRMAEVTALRDQVLAFWTDWGELANPGGRSGGRRTRRRHCRERTPKTLRAPRESPTPGRSSRWVAVTGAGCGAGPRSPARRGRSRRGGHCPAPELPRPAAQCPMQRRRKPRRKPRHYHSQEMDEWRT